MQRTIAQSGLKLTVGTILLASAVCAALWRTSSATMFLQLPLVGVLAGWSLRVRALSVRAVQARAAG